MFAKFYIRFPDANTVNLGCTQARGPRSMTSLVCTSFSFVLVQAQLRYLVQAETVREGGAQWYQARNHGRRRLPWKIFRPPLENCWT